jgi:hypothetical protein
MRPNTPHVGMLPAFVAWSPNPFLQGGALAAFAIIVFAAIVLALHPSLLAGMARGLRHHHSTTIAKVLAVCATYMMVGPSLILLNKEIMQTLHFDLPLTISCMGLLTTAIVIRSLVALGVCEIRPETYEALAGTGWYKSVLPIALAKAATLATGNAVYLHLGLGFIQMLKAFTPVIVVVVMGIFGVPLPTQMARWGVYLIISGTLVEVKGELHVTAIGMGLMLTSEVMEAINLVLTQKLLHNCKFTLVEGLYVIAPASGIFLFCAALVLELPRFLERYSTMVDNPGYFVGSCALGLVVNFVGLAVVQATSSLTVKVLNTIRGICVIMVGFLFYGEHCTNMELAGYSVALLGFALYNYAQLVFVSAEKSDNSGVEETPLRRTA